MNGNTHHMPTFCLHASAYHLHIKAINLFKVLPKTSLCETFLQPKLQITALMRILFLRTLSYLTTTQKNKWQLQLRCFPRKVHQQHFPGPQVAPVIQSRPGLRCLTSNLPFPRSEVKEKYCDLPSKDNAITMDRMLGWSKKRTYFEKICCTDFMWHQTIRRLAIQLSIPILTFCRRRSAYCHFESFNCFGRI